MTGSLHIFSCVLLLHLTAAYKESKFQSALMHAHSTLVAARGHLLQNASPALAAATEPLLQKFSNGSVHYCKAENDDECWAGVCLKREGCRKKWQYCDNARTYACHMKSCDVRNGACEGDKGVCVKFQNDERLWCKSRASDQKVDGGNKCSDANPCRKGVCAAKMNKEFFCYQLFVGRVGCKDIGGHDACEGGSYCINDKCERSKLAVGEEGCKDSGGNSACASAYCFKDKCERKLSNGEKGCKDLGGNAVCVTRYCFEDKCTGLKGTGDTGCKSLGADLACHLRSGERQTCRNNICCIPAVANASRPSQVDEKNVGDACKSGCECKEDLHCDEVDKKCTTPPTESGDEASMKETAERCSLRDPGLCSPAVCQKRANCSETSEEREDCINNPTVCYMKKCVGDGDCEHGTGVCINQWCKPKMGKKVSDRQVRPKTACSGDSDFNSCTEGVCEQSRAPSDLGKYFCHYRIWARLLGT
mmetsp:Transcript_126386/g.230244  ORF Transcript_126386/g.230244 Transcript_126386/m.230244 type:complete len:476 (+) Transcript_126386:62-1489(+)